MILTLLTTVQSKINFVLTVY